jgi:hypothetical protein
MLRLHPISKNLIKVNSRSVTPVLSVATRNYFFNAKNFQLTGPKRKAWASRIGYWIVGLPAFPFQKIDNMSRDYIKNNISNMAFVGLLQVFAWLFYLYLFFSIYF